MFYCKTFEIANTLIYCYDHFFLKQQLIQQAHHWREGNLSPSTKCAHCKHTCGSIECLASVKCSWCGLSVSFLFVFASADRTQLTLHSLAMTVINSLKEESATQY